MYKRQVGHTFGAWKTTKEATLTETGSRERVCTVCGYVETQTLAVLAPVDNGGQQSATSQNPDGQNVGSQNSADGQSKTASPKTGDQSLMGIGLGALALAGVGLTVLTVMGKKKRQEQ